MKNDIKNIADIELLVDSFYKKVRQNDLLKDIFNHIIQDKWPQHLEKMVRFWQTVALEEHTYQGSPFLPHARLPVSKEHFDIWLNLFDTTVDELFIGEKATRVKWQGARMAELFNSKIEYYKSNSAIPLI
ncbi:MAG: group III truncated hemoglobin [bacterium]|nr:group III truncated hemoglobin [bacterium]